MNSSGHLKITSIPHLWQLVWLILLTAPGGLVYFALMHRFEQGEIIPPQGYFAVGAFASIAFFCFMSFPTFFKLIRIHGSEMVINFPLLLKKKHYRVTDIVGHVVYSNWGSIWDYETIHFELADGNTYMIVQFEYFNYRQIKSFITNNSAEKQISKYHNLKSLLIFLAISALLSAILIAVFNYSVK